MEPFDASEFTGLTFDSEFESLLGLDVPASRSTGDGVSCFSALTKQSGSQAQGSSYIGGSQCPGCAKYKADLDRMDQEHRVNFQFLKKKVISTDRLIRRFKEKQDECESQGKTIESLKQKLDQVTRDSSILSEQLKSAMENVKPLQEDKERLESELKSKSHQIRLLQDRIEAEEAYKSQKSALDEYNRNLENAVTVLKRQNNTLTTKTHLLESQLKDAEREKKNLANRNSIIDKRLENLAIALNEAQNAFKSYWNKFRSSGLVKGEKRPSFIPNGYKSIIRKVIKDRAEKLGSRKGNKHSSSVLGDDSDENGYGSTDDNGDSDHSDVDSAADFENVMDEDSSDEEVARTVGASQKKTEHLGDIPQTVAGIKKPENEIKAKLSPAKGKKPAQKSPGKSAYPDKMSQNLCHTANGLESEVEKNRAMVGSCATAAESDITENRVSDNGSKKVDKEDESEESSLSSLSSSDADSDDDDGDDNIDNGGVDIPAVKKNEIDKEVEAICDLEEIFSLADIADPVSPLSVTPRPLSAASSPIAFQRADDTTDYLEEVAEDVGSEASSKASKSSTREDVSEDVSSGVNSNGGSSTGFRPTGRGENAEATSEENSTDSAPGKVTFFLSSDSDDEEPTAGSQNLSAGSSTPVLCSLEHSAQAVPCFDNENSGSPVKYRNSTESDNIVKNGGNESLSLRNSDTCSVSHTEIAESNINKSTSKTDGLSSSSLAVSVRTVSNSTLPELKPATAECDAESKNSDEVKSPFKRGRRRRGSNRIDSDSDDNNTVEHVNGHNEEEISNLQESSSPARRTRSQFVSLGFSLDDVDVNVWIGEPAKAMDTNSGNSDGIRRLEESGEEKEETSERVTRSKAGCENDATGHQNEERKLENEKNEPQEVSPGQHNVPRRRTRSQSCAQTECDSGVKDNTLALGVVKSHKAGQSLRGAPGVLTRQRRLRSDSQSSETSSRENGTGSKGAEDGAGGIFRRRTRSRTSETITDNNQGKKVDSEIGDADRVNAAKRQTRSQSSGRNDNLKCQNGGVENRTNQHSDPNKILSAQEAGEKHVTDIQVKKSVPEFLSPIAKPGNLRVDKSDQNSIKQTGSVAQNNISIVGICPLPPGTTQKIYVEDILGDLNDISSSSSEEENDNLLEKSAGAKSDAAKHKCQSRISMRKAGRSKDKETADNSGIKKPAKCASLSDSEESDGGADLISEESQQKQGVNSHSDYGGSLERNQNNGKSEAKRIETSMEDSGAQRSPHAKSRGKNSHPSAEESKNEVQADTMAVKFGLDILPKESPVLRRSRRNSKDVLTTAPVPQEVLDMGSRLRTRSSSRLSESDATSLADTEPGTVKSVIGNVTSQESMAMPGQDVGETSISRTEARRSRVSRNVEVSGAQNTDESKAISESNGVKETQTAVAHEAQKSVRRTRRSSRLSESSVASATDEKDHTQIDENLSEAKSTRKIDIERVGQTKRTESTVKGRARCSGAENHNTAAQSKMDVNGVTTEIEKAVLNGGIRETSKSVSRVSRKAAKPVISLRKSQMEIAAQQLSKMLLKAKSSYAEKKEKITGVGSIATRSSTRKPRSTARDAGVDGDKSDSDSGADQSRETHGRVTRQRKCPTRQKEAKISQRRTRASNTHTQNSATASARSVAASRDSEASTSDLDTSSLSSDSELENGSSATSVATRKSRVQRLSESSRTKKGIGNDKADQMQKDPKHLPDVKTEDSEKVRITSSEKEKESEMMRKAHKKTKASTNCLVRPSIGINGLDADLHLSSEDESDVSEESKARLSGSKEASVPQLSGGSEKNSKSIHDRKAHSNTTSNHLGQDLQLSSDGEDEGKNHGKEDGLQTDSKYASSPRISTAKRAVDLPDENSRSQITSSADQRMLNAGEQGCSSKPEERKAEDNDYKIEGKNFVRCTRKASKTVGMSGGAEVIVKWGRTLRDGQALQLSTPEVGEEGIVKGRRGRPRKAGQNSVSEGTKAKTVEEMRVKSKEFISSSSSSDEEEGLEENVNKRKRRGGEESDEKCRKEKEGNMTFKRCFPQKNSNDNVSVKLCDRDNGPDKITNDDANDKVETPGAKHCDILSVDTSFMSIGEQCDRDGSLAGTANIDADKSIQNSTSSSSESNASVNSSLNSSSSVDEVASKADVSLKSSDESVNVSHDSAKDKDDSLIDTSADISVSSCESVDSMVKDNAASDCTHKELPSSLTSTFKMSEHSAFTAVKSPKDSMACQPSFLESTVEKTASCLPVSTTHTSDSSEKEEASSVTVIKDGGDMVYSTNTKKRLAHTKSESANIAKNTSNLTRNEKEGTVFNSHSKTTKTSSASRFISFVKSDTVLPGTILSSLQGKKSDFTGEHSLDSSEVDKTFLLSQKKLSLPVMKLDEKDNEVNFKHPVVRKRKLSFSESHQTNGTVSELSVEAAQISATYTKDPPLLLEIFNVFKIARLLSPLPPSPSPADERSESCEPLVRFDSATPMDVVKVTPLTRAGTGAVAGNTKSGSLSHQMIEARKLLAKRKSAVVAKPKPPSVGKRKRDQEDAQVKKDVSSKKQKLADLSGFPSAFAAITHDLEQFLSGKNVDVKTTVDTMLTRVNGGDVKTAWELLQNVAMKCIGQKLDDVQCQLLAACEKEGVIDTVFISEQEKCLVQLLSAFVKLDKELDRGSLMGKVWTAIFSRESTSESTRLSLCRLFTCLCMEQGDLEQARVLIYNIAWCGYLDLAPPLMAIVGVWSDTLSPAYSISKSTIRMVLELILRDTYKNRQGILEKVSLVMRRVCHWDINQVSHTPEALLELLLQQLRHLVQNVANGSKTDISFEAMKAVELLLVYQGQAWSEHHLVKRTLMSVAMKWASKGGDNDGPPPGFVVCLLSILRAYVAVQPLSGGAAGTLLKAVFTSLINAKATILSVETACVEALLELAPFNAEKSLELLKKWQARNKGNIPPEIFSKILQARSILSSHSMASHSPASKKKNVSAKKR